MAFMLVELLWSEVEAFGLHRQQLLARTETCLSAEVSNSPKVTEDGPAGIGGAEFFGGNKEKEEFYNEEEEQSATISIAPETIDTSLSQTSSSSSSVPTSMSRFDRREAFQTETVAAVAQSLQSQFNHLLHPEAPLADVKFTYDQSTRFQWATPLSVKARTPLEELREHTLDFFKGTDLAIVGGQEGPEGSNTIEIQWELSVVWPTFWEPRVLFLGSSTLTLDGNTIVGQLDKVVSDSTSSSDDLLGTMAKQILPRFWDWYHIGMTPSAELMPKINRKQPSASPFGLEYETYDLPGRWMTKPTMLETGTRVDRNAQTVPNHAFSCIIKTMGPTRQKYVPTSPVEVQLLNDPQSQRLQLQWSIPLSVEFQSHPDWLLAQPDEETPVGSQPQCDYVYQPRRKVATVRYGGEAQDKEVSEIRKQLYEQVIKDGLKPKLDPETGRPIFFFLQNTSKACYTEEGLGMCVYEWRPKLAKANEIGLELELPGGTMISSKQ